MKIVVTGSHLTPALATISQLRKLKSETKFYFFGRRYAIEGDKSDSFEYLEVAKYKIPFFEIPAGRLQRRLTRYTLPSLLKVLPGIAKSFYLLLKIRPNLVLTFGGYLALPVALASCILRIPVVAHEQSPNLGLSNKIIFKIAKLKAVSDKKLEAKLNDTAIIFTGPLFRQEIFKTQPTSKNVKQFLEKIQNEKLVFVTGGATGSYYLNEILAKIIKKVLESNFVIHQTGNFQNNKDFKKLSGIKNGLPLRLKERYFLTQFITTADIGVILKRADLVICRAGANTTAELSVLGKVAIIIPLMLGEEQKQIAESLGESGQFIIIPQEQVSAEKLLNTITAIFENFNQYTKSAKVNKENVFKDGANIFSNKILSKFTKLNGE